MPCGLSQSYGPKDWPKREGSYLICLNPNLVLFFVKQKPLCLLEQPHSLLGCENIVDAGRTVAWSVILAQATRSRLGETFKEPTPVRARALAQAEGLSFEQGAISLRRETLA
ncbi:hypothetical protein DEO72_LG9g1293 [Vigna unguiculata]|uniref:Uncharacterized protein n=1 Tax=Vigna unguiculata TaxID=3917 RepID=A0A4D6N022_VIGUN|nr:hypothetical protein DEO72_LG9g1293 [Vigna unguiculata]